MIVTANMSDISEHPEDEIDLFSPRQYRLSLWYFLFDLLEKKGTEKIIIWANRDELEFRIVNANALARAWGKLKGKTNMTYPKFSRAMRYYYRKNVIQKINGKRYTYRFIESELTHDVFQSFNCRLSRQNVSPNHTPAPAISICAAETERSSPNLVDSFASMNLPVYTNGACAQPSTLSLELENYNNSERRRSSAALMEELIKQAVAGKSIAQMNRANDLNNKPYLDILTEEDFCSYKNTNEFGKSCISESNMSFVTTDSIAQSLAQAVPYVNSVNCSWGSATQTYCASNGCDFGMDHSSLPMDITTESYCNYPISFSEDMYR